MRRLICALLGHCYALIHYSDCGRTFRKCRCGDLDAIR